MSSFFVQGPIDAKQEFIMVYPIGTTLYVLNTYVTDGIRRLFFDPTVVDSIAAYHPVANVPIFLASGTLDKMQITIKNLGGALSYTSDNKAGVAAAPPDMAASSPGYAPWGPLFLSGIPYTFTRSGGSTPITFNVGTDPLNLTGTTTTPILVPTTWYFGCSGDTANTASDSGLTICASQCYINPANPVCNPEADSYCAGVPTTAWTTGPECKDGTVYTYCPVREKCSSACKGPCSNSLYVCTPNTEAVGYTCKFTTDNIFKGQWWKSTWFIVTVIVVFILGIIAVIIMYNIYKKNKAKSASESSTSSGSALPSSASLSASKKSPSSSSQPSTMYVLPKATSSGGSGKGVIVLTS